MLALLTHSSRFSSKVVSNKNICVCVCYPNETCYIYQASYKYGYPVILRRPLRLRNMGICLWSQKH